MTTTTKGIADMPVLQFTEEDFWTGRLPIVEAQQAQVHGPVFKRMIDDGPQVGLLTVFLVGPEANRMVMHTRRQAFSHDRGWTPVIGEIMGKGLLNMDDPEHARHRKMWNPAFTSAYMESYLPLLQDVIAEHTARWAERGEIDVYQGAREITFDVAARALAGVPHGPEVERLQQLFYTLLYGGGMVTAETYEEYIQKAMAARAELLQTLLRIIAERRASPTDVQPRDVLGMIVRARDENGEALSDEQVLGHLNILLVAGHETTTMLASWVLYYLATMPEQRERIAAELTGLLGDSQAPITVEMMRGMKHLDNFIRETGRLHPPVLHVPRGVLEDVEFAGYTIPAGTQIRLALAATHHLPEVFADPEVFDADRFAAPRDEEKRTPYALVTFGGGSRICIGINFANIEVKALAAHVLRNYHMEPVRAEPPVQAGFITTVIPDGLPMRIRPLT